LPIIAQAILKALKDDILATTSPTEIRKKLLDVSEFNLITLRLN